MRPFDVYQDKFAELTKRLETIEHLGEKDTAVASVLRISKEILGRPLDNQSTAWLLSAGGELIGQYHYLANMADNREARFSLAQLAYRSVRDNLMIGYKDSEQFAGMKITEAKARAEQDLTDAQVDLVAREYEATRYRTAAEVAMEIKSFIQSTIRSKENSKYDGRFHNEGGQP